MTTMKIKLANKFQKMNYEEAKKAFAEYDTDNDGLLTVQEYIINCRCNGSLVKDDDLVKMFKIFANRLRSLICHE